MKITHYSTFTPMSAAAIEEAYCGVTMRRVISEVDGADTSIMDVFEIAPNGETPFHSHPWEHQVFVISGKGHCRDASGERSFRDGDVIYVPPDEPHGFRNSGPVPVKLVCVIPKAAVAAYHLKQLGEENTG